MPESEGISMMSSRDQKGFRSCVSVNHGQRLVTRENPLVLGNLDSWTAKDTSPVQSATLVSVMRCVSAGYSSIGGVDLRRSKPFRSNESNLHGVREQIAEHRNTEACASLALGGAAMRSSIPTLPKKDSKAVGIVDTQGAASKLLLAILTWRRVDAVLREKVNYLEAHFQVVRACHRGLTTHPARCPALNQMRFGGGASFSVDSGYYRVRVTPSCSWSGQRTVYFRSADVTVGFPEMKGHVELNECQRQIAWMLSKGLFYYSVAIEDPEDLIAESDRPLHDRTVEVVGPRATRRERRTMGRSAW